MSLIDTILPSFLKPVADAVSTVVDRVVVDRNAAQRTKDEIAVELNKAMIAGDLAQLDINKVEAASPKLFVAGWRPYIGWVGGTGFAVQFVLVPFAGYTAALLGYTAPPPIQLDPMLMEVMLAMLGLNIGARTYEKVKSVASK